MKNKLEIKFTKTVVEYDSPNKKDFIVFATGNFLNPITHRSSLDQLKSPWRSSYGQTFYNLWPEKTTRLFPTLHRFHIEPMLTHFYLNYSFLTLSFRFFTYYFKVLSNLLVLIWGAWCHRTKNSIFKLWSLYRITVM